MYKTKIYTNQVNRFLDEYFKNFVDNIQEIQGGEFSQAFSFEKAGNKFVVRFNSFTDLGFKKEEIINSEFALIPTPRIIDIGKYKDFHFSITKSCEGVQLNKLDKTALESTLPSLFTTMNIIHTTKVDFDGFGLWDITRVGKFNSFEEQLRYFIKEDQWEGYAKQLKFFHIDFVKQLKDEFEGLLMFVPKKRYFLHGDFGRTNIFGLDNKIESIIDWAEAMYGDFLLDLTWLAFWEDKVDVINEYYEFNKDSKDLDMTNFKERVRLYLLFTSLNNLVFELGRGREYAYNDALNAAKRNLGI